jgi:GNAT superfamily N-acetyltransferase
MPNEHTQIALRPATLDDAGQVAEIWLTGWSDGHLGHVPDELTAVRTPESFATRAKERVEDTFVATVAGAVAGFVMVGDDEVEQVYVSGEHRGTGIAAILLSEAERLVREHGHARAWLAVVAGNLRARVFYERNGWVDEGPFAYQAKVEGGSISVPCHRYVKAL